MKTKIIGLFICILLIATAFPVVGSLNDSTITSIPKSYQSCTKSDWSEMKKLLASDGATDAIFGTTVSLDGDTALIGAPLGNGNEVLSGSAYVFTRTGTTWTQQQKLIASDGIAFNEFGCSVSLSGDTALIGAREWSSAPGFGSAYVFTRTGTTWTQQQKLIASDGAPMDQFGNAVALSGDTALIGAPYDDDHGSVSGSAYVFIRTGNTWTQQTKLIASDGYTNDEFGKSVSLSGDTALIGAWMDDALGTNSGSAYVFTRTGTTWTQQQKLIASDGAPDERFGWSVFISGDTALIGAWLDDDNGADSGSAYVFIRTGNTWTQQTKLIASDGVAGDWFGSSVSLDGDTALIGAYKDDDNGQDSGSAYVFIRTGTTWTQQQKLIASDGGAGDCFGKSVSLSGDTALIGAPYDDDNGVDSGSAFVFTRAGEINVYKGIWVPDCRNQPIDTWIATLNYYGYSLLDIVGVIALANDKTQALYPSTVADYSIPSDPIEPLLDGLDELGYHCILSIQPLDTDVVDLINEILTRYSHHSCLIGMAVDVEWKRPKRLGYGWVSESEADSYINVIQAYQSTYELFLVHFVKGNLPADQTGMTILFDGFDKMGNKNLVLSIYKTWSKTWSSVGIYIFDKTTMIPDEDIMDTAPNTGYIIHEEYKIHGMNININGGLGINVMIQNNGDAKIGSIPWEIHIEGGMNGKINKTLNGTIDINPGESKTIATGALLGFGNIHVSAIVGDAKNNADAIQLFTLSIVKK